MLSFLYMRRGQRHVSFLALLTSVSLLSVSAPAYLFAEELDAILPEVEIVVLPSGNEAESDAKETKDEEIKDDSAVIDAVTTPPEADPPAIDEEIVAESEPLLEVELFGIGLRVAHETNPPVVHAVNIEYPLIIATSNYQTSLKSGDAFNLVVVLNKFEDVESVVADLSQLGIHEPVALPSPELRPTFRVNGVTVGSGLTDGPKTITITATNVYGQSSTFETFVEVDTTPPSVTLEFSPVNQGRVVGNSLGYLSGSVLDNSGSVEIGTVRYYPLDANGALITPPYISWGGLAMRKLFNGNFFHEPFHLDNFPVDAAQMAFELQTIDAAGNTSYATTSTPIAYFREGTAPTLEPAMSNVMFLPGVKGSRIYSANGEELWFPKSESQIRSLFLSLTGESLTKDTYVRSRDVLDAVSIPLLGDIKIYGSFIEDMNALQTAGKIAEWEPVAYDWRYSLYHLMATGVARDGKIFYGEAEGTPYMIKRLKELSQTSKTGKVTIVAHSNGGLVAKALMNDLGNTLQSKYIDRVIFVGVPHSGSPQAIGTLLYGYDESIPLRYSAATGRAFAQNAPVAYHLLPSRTYIESAAAAGTPVITFPNASSYQEEYELYGDTVDRWEELRDFILARDGGRTKPQENDLKGAEIGNPSLTHYASEVHNQFDNWLPANSVKVYQIAGTNMRTLTGIDYYEWSIPYLEPTGAKETYRPRFSLDGDGVVPEFSAHLMHSGEAIKKFWVDLNAGQPSIVKKKHAQMLEIESLRNLTVDLLDGVEGTLPDGISLTKPPRDQRKFLGFYLHSPLTLTLRDEAGNLVGPGQDGTIHEDVSDSTYGTIGEVQFIIVPSGPKYHLELDGYKEGQFTLELIETKDDFVSASTTFAAIASTELATATIEINGGIENLSSLKVDIDGDGDTDSVYVPVMNQTVSEPTQMPIEEELAEEAIGTDSESSGGSKISSSALPNLSATVIAPLTYPALVQEMSQNIVNVTSSLLHSSNTDHAEIVAIETTEKDDFYPKPSKTQTATVYDAIGQQAWVSEAIRIVYNFINNLWQNFLELFSD